MLSSWDYSQTKRTIFDSGSDLDRCGRLEHCSNSRLACKASFILDAANSNRPSIQTYRSDVVKRQPGIHQRHSDCGAFYAQDPILVRSNRNRPQYGTPRRGLGPMSGLMTALWSHVVHGHIAGWIIWDAASGSINERNWLVF